MLAGAGRDRAVGGEPDCVPLPVVESGRRQRAVLRFELTQACRALLAVNVDDENTGRCSRANADIVGEFFKPSAQRRRVIRRVVETAPL